MLARSFACLLAAGMVVLSGCGPGKLDVNKTMELEGGEVKSIILDAQSHPQTMTVEFETNGGLVNVGLFKDADAKDLNTIQFSKALKSEKQSKKGTFSVELPEKTAAQVVVETAAKV